MRSAEWDGPRSTVLGRASALLAAFTVADDGVGVRELARRAGLPTATAHRIVTELAAHGWLERSGDRYRLGMRLFELGQLVPRQRDLREAALPFMTDLREATRETVHLAVLEGVEVVYVEILRSRDAPPLPSRVGGRMPAHATAVGKVLLAYSPPEAAAARIAAGLPARSPHTIVMPGRLRVELAAVAERGTAYDREESGLGIVCAASPVFGPRDGIVAALSVSGRPTRLAIERVAPAVRTAALALSRDLGARIVSPP